MESQYQGDRWAPSTDDSRGTAPPLDVDWSGWPGQFVSELDQILGADSEPDPLFFVESWTLDPSAAVENLHKRRQEHAHQQQAHREPEANAFQSPGFIRTQAFIEQQEFYAEFITSARAATVTGYPNAATPPQSSRGLADWAQAPSSQEQKRISEESDNTHAETAPMTHPRACRLLGVNALSTREQIKSAYRHMATKCHPDRLAANTHLARHSATEKMMEINAAYQLLRSCCRQETA